MDALQAYICAVQLDKSHSAAWTNLGECFPVSIFNFHHYQEDYKMVRLSEIIALKAFTKSLPIEILMPLLWEKFYKHFDLSKAEELKGNSGVKKLMFCHI